MAFSLSPSVDVTEKDLSVSVANLPSSKTAMVVKAATGEALKIVQVTSVGDLETIFGFPTNFNYKDWFNAWNFLQYANSLYCVRPLSTKAHNCAVALSGGTGQADAPAAIVDADGNPTLDDKGVQTYGAAKLGTGMKVNEAVSCGKLYNSDVAELRLNALAEVPSLTKTFFDVSIDGVSGEITSKIVSNLAGKEIKYDNKEYYIEENVWEKAGITEELMDSEGEVTLIKNFKAVKVDQRTDDEKTAEKDPYYTKKVVIAKVSASKKLLLEMTADNPALPVMSKYGVTGAEVKEDPTGSFKVAGAVAPKLVLYNRYVTNEQDVAVSVCSSKDSWNKPLYLGTAVKFSDFFDYEPEWDQGQFVMIVFKKNPQGNYENKEEWLLSYNVKGRDHNNSNIFAEEVIKNKSKYLYVKVGTNGDPVNTSCNEMIELQHSTFESVTPREADVFPTISTEAYKKSAIVNACELFSDPDSFDINILVQPAEAPNKMSNLAETRKDCVAVIGPYEHDNLLGKSNGEATAYMTGKYGTVAGKPESKVYSAFGTYSAVYGNMKYQYDKYNDLNRWVPVLGDVAGLYAATDKDLDPWWAPAGLSRGKIKNCIKLAFNPNKAHRDELYYNAINPIMGVPGEGTAIVWGQKTATAKPSAFNRLNVRRLMITIEKSVATSARYFLFEFNDSFTRNFFKGMVDPYLGGIQSRRGLYDYLVVCDDSNNTPEIIDQNGLCLDIYVKPTKVAEFIKIQAVVVKTGASFSEAIGA